VVQLGAGGAGAAVAHAALTLGARALTLFDVDPARAQTLAADLQARFPAARLVAGGELDAALAQASGLIHASPTGMLGHPGLPLPARLLHPRLWVADIVYFPLVTELIAAARALGCRTLTGGGMAVYQAVDAFEIFTGRAPDAERMFAHFQALVAG
jgi:shikimate dehydrogenase